MENLNYNVGNIIKTKEGYNVIITENLNHGKRKIKFLDCFGFEKIVTINSISKGSINNPYHRTVFGIGYFGDGNYKAKENGKHFYYYRVWQSMHDRCYSGKDTNYNNTIICDEWHNYQNFAKWFMNTYPHNLHGIIKIVLDKDLLQNGTENKIYSPTTCIWLPHRINTYMQNKSKDTISGITGVSKLKSDNWGASSVEFESPSKGYYIGTYKNKEYAIEAYINFKLIQDEKAKQYLRDLNYLPESIINLVTSLPL